MSDISIPGVNSKYQTDQMIQKLVKVENTKLDQLKKDLDAYNLQKSAWQNLNRAMTTLRTTARSLYNFENPFNERSAGSSNESVVTAAASREAVEGTTKMEVLQIAAPDRFVSKELPKNTAIPAGAYEFMVGKESVSMRYRGGSVRDFAENLSRRAEGILKASVVQTKPDSQVLVIEGLKSGAQYRLDFKQDAIKLGLDLGLLTVGTAGKLKLPETDGKIIAVAAGQEQRLAVPENLKPQPGMSLELQVKLAPQPGEAKPAQSAPIGPQLPLSPEASIRTTQTRDITSDFPKVFLPQAQEIVDPNVLFAIVDGVEKKLTPVSDSTEFQTVQIPLTNDLNNMQALVVRNRNTNKVLSITNVQIIDPTSRPDSAYKPANPGSTAQDAKIKIDGVEISRPSNIINDVIPGVTLTLQAPSDKPVSIKVEPDRKQVKDKLIEFVAQYNAVIREINVLSARKDNTDVVNELDFLSKDQKDDYLKRIGLYQGETTLTLIKSRLQTIASNPYNTRAGNEIRVLGQIGISTNAGAGGSASLQANSLRGYLEINEKTLDQKMTDNFLAVKDLFGNDSNGDLLVDSGVAFQLDNYAQPYVQSNGILSTRTNTLDQQISSKQKDINKFQDHLKQYEADLKFKYGKMESAIEQINDASRSLRNLNQPKNSN